MRDERFFNEVLREGGELAFSIEGKCYELGPSRGATFERRADGNIYARIAGEEVQMTEAAGNIQRWGSLYINRPGRYVDTSDQRL